jgi:hypothetical protein
LRLAEQCGGGAENEAGQGGSDASAKVDHAFRVKETQNSQLYRLHDPGEFFEFFLHGSEGIALLLDARGGVACLVAGDAVAVLGEEGCEQLGGLKGVEAGLAKLVAKGFELVGRELLEVTHHLQ